MARVRIVFGNSAVGERELGPARMVVGRGDKADLPLDNPLVSRQHCAFEPVGGGWQVVDLGSRAGTRVNGQVVQAKILAAGDHVEIGKHTLVYEGPTATMDAGPAGGDALPQGGDVRTGFWMAALGPSASGSGPSASGSGPSALGSGPAARSGEGRPVPSAARPEGAVADPFATTEPFGATVGRPEDPFTLPEAGPGRRADPAATPLPDRPARPPGGGDPEGVSRRSGEVAPWASSGGFGRSGLGPRPSIAAGAQGASGSNPAAQVGGSGDPPRGSGPPAASQGEALPPTARPEASAPRPVQRAAATGPGASGARPASGAAGELGGDGYAQTVFTSVDELNRLREQIRVGEGPHLAALVSGGKELLPLARERFEVGWTPEADFRLPGSRWLGKRAFRIERDLAGFLIVALSFWTPVTVRGARVKATHLKEGDTIDVLGVRFRFSMGKKS